MTDLLVQERVSSPRLGFEGTVSPQAQMTQFGEEVPYGVNYTEVQGALTFQYAFDNRRWPWLLRRSGPMAKIGGSYMGGDEGNRGSHRYGLLGSMGYRQGLFHWTYVEPQVDAMYAINYLDFGKGVSLVREDSMMLRIRATAGGELCFQNLGCLSAGVGYYLEGTVAGHPHYTNHGLLLTCSTSFSVPMPDSSGTKPRVLERTGSVPSPAPSVPRPLLSRIYFLNEPSRTLATQDTDCGAASAERAGDAQLNAIGRYLQEHESAGFRLHGHRRATGSATADRVASLQHALWAKTYLTCRWGISEDRIQVEGDYKLGLEIRGGKRHVIKVDAQGRSVHGSQEPYFKKPDSSENDRVEFEEFTL